MPLFYSQDITEGRPLFSTGGLIAVYAITGLALVLMGLVCSSAHIQEEPNAKPATVKPHIPYYSTIQVLLTQNGTLLSANDIKVNARAIGRDDRRRFASADRIVVLGDETGQDTGNRLRLSWEECPGLCSEKELLQNLTIEAYSGDSPWQTRGHLAVLPNKQLCIQGTRLMGTRLMGKSFSNKACLPEIRQMVRLLAIPTTSAQAVTSFLANYADGAYQDVLKKPRTTTLPPATRASSPGWLFFCPHLA